MNDEYGIYVGEIKEKELIKLVNAFLSEYFSQNSNYNMYKNNKLAKRKNCSGVDDLEHPEDTFVYDYSYDYYNKYFGAYLMIYGNQNKCEETKYTKDIEWIIMVNRIGYYTSNMKTIDQNNPDIEAFIPLLLNSIGAKYTLLKSQ